MPDIQLGLMIRTDVLPEDDMATRFGEMLEQVRLANQLGFASLCTGMHYAADSLQRLHQLAFLARAMAEGPDLRLCFGVVLLPLQKPIEVAEYIATMDVMSGGKVIFGAGIGYREVEFLAFGASERDRVARFEENLAAVKRLLSGESVDLVGSDWELRGASVSVRPLQKPYPPVWIGANADAAVRRAARLGDCWYINPHNRLDTIARQLDVYRAELDRVGKPFPRELPAHREVFVAASRAEALRLAAPALMEKYGAYNASGQGRAMPEGDNDLGLAFEELVHDRFHVGAPDEVAAELIDMHQRTGINHLIVSVQWPGLPHAAALEAMHLLAEEVMPRVRRA
jgi:alkanesulfonate monooxygenase SsuD/methylene tetrahydromethanopterin reductase-like flavin-dependent oxidoreductase (luciferase family)